MLKMSNLYSVLRKNHGIFSEKLLKKNNDSLKCNCDQVQNKLCLFVPKHEITNIHTKTDVLVLAILLILRHL